MKKTAYIIAFITLTILSCTKGFEELNTNPNSPTEVQPDLLLRQVIYNYGEEMSYEGFVAGNLLAQHFTMIDFNGFDRHALTDAQLGGNPWPVLYKNLRDNQTMLNLSRENDVYAIYEGPALILKAYMAAALTDIYGDVPYFSALEGLVGNVTPKYDSQQDIYLNLGGILDNLEQGVLALQNYSGNQALNGDIFYGGDKTSWVKFANSLKIKYLMRVSGKEDVSLELQEIYDSGMYIKQRVENAAFDFTDGLPNNFRMANLRDGDFNLFIMSLTMQEILESLNDPRRDVLFRPTGANPEVYLGLLNGPDASSEAISVANYSLSGTVFRENTSAIDANFITSWETLFLLAEAAQRGLINASAQELYNEAVLQAFDYWNVEMPASYLTEGSGAYTADGTNPIDQILTQKWLANSMNGYEGWIEWKRTGYPELKQVSSSANNGIIPVRLPYPAEEAVLNGINYSEATAENGNDINMPVWWDSE